MKEYKWMIAIVGVLLAAFVFNIWSGPIMGWFFSQPVVGEAATRAISGGSERGGFPAHWKTDWEKRTIELDELISGGPPRDGIPPIDDPSFVTIEEAADWVDDREPVLVYAQDGIARAYPIQVLTWHEIVNDTVGDTPIAVTYCPLCNAAIVFSRKLGDRTLTLGTSGMLRKSDMVMWDRQTESLWQQLTGEGLVGELAGEQLELLPSLMISFGTFRDEYPNGEVLSKDTGHARRYGQNPYAGYDVSAKPFLYHDDIDDRLAAMDRVVAFMHGDGIAYSYDLLVEKGVVNTEIDGRPVVIFYQPGTASAMHATEIKRGRDVGAVGVFNRQVGDRVLTFEQTEDSAFTDTETGSTWSLAGVATSGEMKGQVLDQVLHFNHFWFAWQAFYPDTALHHTAEATMSPEATP